jgi:hypothetical protein
MFVMLVKIDGDSERPILVNPRTVAYLEAVSDSRSRLHFGGGASALVKGGMSAVAADLAGAAFRPGASTGFPGA